MIIGHLIRRKTKQKQTNGKKQQGRRITISAFKFLCPIPLSERFVQLKLALKTHGKRGQSKNLEGIYGMPARGSNIVKVSATTLTGSQKRHRQICHPT